MSLKRLDILVVQRGLAKSREEAKELILSGSVWSQGLALSKPATQVDVNHPLELRTTEERFSSRAGLKLQHAIETFQVSPKDRICLDIGSSTGGFTDCLLKRGAKQVFAVDVGYGLLDYRLRNDKRVTLLERKNARYLEREDLMKLDSSAESISLVTIDVSFISLNKIIPAVKTTVCSGTDFLLLFKPQFEVSKDAISKKGLVKDEKKVFSTLEEFSTFMKNEGFIQHGNAEASPVAGKKSGNVEYLLHFQKI